MTENKEQSKMVPKRRFKAFENEDGWVQRELGEVGQISTGNTPPTSNSDNYAKHGMPWVTPTDIDDNIIKNTAKKLSKIGIIKARIVPKGAILVTSIASIGKNALILENSAFNQQINSLVPNTQNDSYFLLTQSELWSNKMKSIAALGTIQIVNKTEFSNLTFFFPKLEEQKQIGNFFMILDQTITIQQQKLEKLKAMKSAYLSEMFPAEGERKPKRRFPGFTDDWEQRYFLNTLKTIVDFRGRTPKKLGMEWSDSGYLALSALNVKKGYIDFAEVAHYGNQELYDKWMSGKELYQGQVLFTTEAPMGNVAQVPDGKGYILSQRTIAFNIDETLLTDDFLYVLLGSPRIFDDLSALSSGGTAKGVSQKSLEQLKVHIPKDLDEQKQIGIFFKNLDQTIILQQEKLEKLQNIKKAYLNEMFI